MNTAIIGYGRMGHEIEKILLKRGHQVKQIIDLENKNDLKLLAKNEIDVAIEFTSPASAYHNILHCFNEDIPVVSGTTGWMEKLNELKKISVGQNKGFVYASNFSVGVNILFTLNKMLASIMNNFPAYNVDIEEIHHTKKLDSPSGTAITIAEAVISEIDRLGQWELNDSPAEGTLGIKSVRTGDVPGIHTIKYESGFDSIALTHSAKSREGFALGAVLAAEFIRNKTGFYEMSDVFQLNGN